MRPFLPLCTLLLSPVLACATRSPAPRPTEARTIAPCELAFRVESAGPRAFEVTAPCDQTVVVGREGHPRSFLVIEGALRSRTFEFRVASSEDDADDPAALLSSLQHRPIAGSGTTPAAYPDRVPFVADVWTKLADGAWKDGSAYRVSVRMPAPSTTPRGPT